MTVIVRKAGSQLIVKTESTPPLPWRGYAQQFGGVWISEKAHWVFPLDREPHVREIVKRYLS